MSRPIRVRRTTAAVALLLAATAGWATTAPASAGVRRADERKGDRFDVHLLGVNDFHGNLTGTGLKYDDPYDGVTGSFPAGGAARLAYELKSRKAAAPETTLLVHSGDMVGASPPESGLLQDEPSVKLMNEIGFDVGTPGNHEFDEGVPEMFRLLFGGDHPATDGVFEGQNFPDISANIVCTGTIVVHEGKECHAGETLLPPYLVKKVKGVKIGFIGATTVTTPSIVVAGATAGLEFRDEADSINKYVPKLEREGVRAIVVLIHEGGFQTGFPEGTAVSDRIKTIVSRLKNQIDLVVAGHTHSVLNIKTPNSSARPVRVVQASSFGRAFDDITLTIDKRTKDVAVDNAVIRPVWQNVPFDSTTPGPKDPGAQAIVDDAVAKTAPLVSRVVNTAAADITRTKNADGESALGDLIADGQRAEMNTQLAFMNSGGIRADINAGPVTWGNLFSVQPFANDLITMDLTGAQIWTLLGQQFQPQNSVVRLGEVSGFHYDYTSTGLYTGVINGVWLGLPGDLSMPIANDTSTTYSITVNNFMAGGGDGYTVLTTGTNRVQGPTDLVALVNYVGSLPNPFNYAIQGRINQLP